MKNVPSNWVIGYITVAVAHTIFKAVYYMLKNNTPYKELGSDFFEQRRKNEIVKKSVKRLEALGFNVTIEESINSSTA